MTVHQAKFVKNDKYYTGRVYEWNLPTGWTCPSALECKVSVDRQTGKFDINKGAYRCYAASPERFPAVRNHRWTNFELAKQGIIPDPPKDCTDIRIHASGDFFNQNYFDAWIKYAHQHSKIRMWAYTKSIRYWISRINVIPSNMILTASYGGREDHLIEVNSLKNVKVYKNKEDVPGDRPIDTNDDYARIPHINFALLDNMKYSKNENKRS
jgi:hypothetical protein